MSSILRETPEFQENLPEQLAEVIQLPVASVAAEVAVADVVEQPAVEPEAGAVMARVVSSYREPGVTTWSDREFLNELGRIPRASREEEIDLGSRIQTGILAQEDLDVMLQEEGSDPEVIAELQRTASIGKQAEVRLIEANLRLVVWAAKPWRTRSTKLGFEDIIQNGVIGLIRAVQKFDPTQETRFSTYAVPWIKQAITREMDNTERTIRFPVHVEETRRARNVFFEDWEKEHGALPSDDDFIAHKNSKVSEATVQKAIESERVQPESLDAPVTTDDPHAATKGEMIVGPDIYAGDKKIQQQQEDKADIICAFQSIEASPYQQAALSLYSGVYLPFLEGSVIETDNAKVVYTAALFQEGGLTYQKIGEMFGRTHEAVRQANNRTMKLLAAAFAKQGRSMYAE